ncbi:MAG: BMP family ABC transporter substrate-binding protein [Euzebyaceae bacterium]|nr:BMP family ABC transporter substrate-binding protein [Euzebyaceae bacterium]
MRFDVLGRLRVVDGRGRGGEAAGLRLGGARQQLVLALLLAEANSVVSTDALVDGLWGDSPPSAARHTVQGYVSELRKLLGPVIEREGPGYVVRVDDSSLDSLEFEALISRGRNELADDPVAAVASLSAALGLWRGAPFTGLDDAAVLLAERTRLEQLQLLAFEDRAGAELALGRHREVVAELDALSCEHPYREELRAQHMLALYRSGRQAEALRAFQRTRAALVEELGLEPSPLLRQLEEQILVQDPALDLASASDDEASSDPSGPVTNPYKGLRAFTEADADVFYGRDELIAQLASIVAGDGGLTAVVGPSGSGKSSLVQAGLIPALRNADRSGANWVIALMRPGAYPFTELEAALVRAVDEPPVTISLLWKPDSDLLRAVSRILAEDGSLLLVIDQFEELFTLVDDEQRDAFLRGLIALATDPRGRSRVLVTLRADFYDRPLMHPAFGRLMTGHVVNVMPLAAEELEAAALGPASRVGVTFQRGLLAALIDEASGQPNALPLFQYTLTELFERRQDTMLTRAAYQELGGIRGAVASRAEEIYQRLDLEQQQAAHQLFLRLVTVGRDAETRRVVAASELITLDVDTVTMHGAVEALVANRLLVRDRDAVSGALTLEVAHEALLSEWDRLRRWIDDGRDDLRQLAAYTHALDDWLTAGRDPDYLLTAGRLDQFEQWRATTTMRLTAPERDFLDDARRQRDDAEAAEIAHRAEQARLRRRARGRAFALGAAVTAIGTVAIVAVITAAGTRDPPKIDFVSSLDLTGNEPGAQYEQGLVRAERDFDLVIERHDLAASETVVAELAASDTDLVVLDSDATRSIAPDDLDPDTRYVLTDYAWDDVRHDPDPLRPQLGGHKFDALPNVTSHQWANEHAGFLAGVAAASTTETGTVGFVGATRTGPQEDYRAGFEAGVQSIDPDIRIFAVYLAAIGDGREPYDAPEAGRFVADRLYDEGADVIFHVAGRSGAGVSDAASRLSAHDLWTIGAETDQWEPASTRQRPHILTSILRRSDLQIYSVIDDYLDGSLDPGAHRLTAADGMITYAESGDALSADARANLDRATEQLASGAIRPPRTPSGVLTEPESLLEPGTGTSFFAGARAVPVRATLPVGWETENVFIFKSDADPLLAISFFDVANIYADPCQWALLDPPVGPTVDDLASALADSPVFQATGARDVTVDGFEGKYIEFTVPDYSEDECKGRLFGLWKEDGPFGVSSGNHPNLWAQSPDQHNQVWILDVDGTRLVILAWTFPDTSAHDRADIDEILDSIQIG